MPPAIWIRPSPLRDGVFSGLVVFLAALGSLLWLSSRAEETQSQSIRVNLERTARAAAGLVDGDLHVKLVELGVPNGPDYDKAVAPLVKFHRGVPEIAYLYTLIVRDDKLFFVLDTATKASELGFNRVMKSSPLLEPYN